MGDNRDVLLSTLADSFISDSEQLKYYNTYIDAIHENQLLGTKKTSNIQSVVSDINSSLDSSKKRLEALCVLRELISQCCTEVFTQNGTLWLRLLIQALQSHDPAVTMNMTCELTSKILSHTVSFPELSRDVASSVIPALIPVLLENKQSRRSALSCLAACMTHYNGPCGPFKNKIEAKVVPLLDGSHKDLEDVACECYALLASCGGGGSQGVKHAEAWSVLCQRLIGSLNDTLTALLQAVQMGVEDTPEPAHRLVLMPVPVSEPSHTCVLQTRFSCLIKALSTMLNTHYTSTVLVPLDDILQVICRALSVTPKQIMFHATQERVLLCSVLPLIQAKAFSLLQAVIQSCKTNLIAYGTTINKIFIQTLNWSSPPESQFGHEKPYSGLKCELYKTLSKWVQIIGASSGIESVMSDLLTHWVKDVTPQVDSVKLDSRMSQKVDALMTGGGKKKRKQGGGDVGQLTGQRKVIRGANQNTCTAALQAMRQIVLSLGPFLKAKHHKTLHALVVPLLLDVHQGVQNSQGLPPLPYDSAACRQALYQLLLAMVLCPHANTAPPTQCAIRLFTLGLRDQEISVSSMCTESLAITEALVHPRAPILTSPPEPATQENAQQGPSNVFGFGYYNNASFGPGPVFSVTSQRKETLPSSVRLVSQESRSFQSIERSVTSSEAKEGEKSSVEVVSIVSSESEGEKSDSGEEEEGGESGMEGSEEEEEDVREGEDVIAIDDDSNSVASAVNSSPLPSTSNVTSSSASATLSKKRRREDVVVTSSQSMDNSDCLIVSADTSHACSTTTRERKESGDAADHNDSIHIIESASVEDNNGENNNIDSSSEVVPPAQKRKHVESDVESCSKSSKKTEEDGLETNAMLATFVDAGPDSE